MKKIDRYRFFLNFFKKKIPNPQTELVYKTPFQLLVAVVLSAQCTDERVNKVTPGLFSKFPTPQLLATADVEDIKECSLIHPNINIHNPNPLRNTDTPLKMKKNNKRK